MSKEEESTTPTIVELEEQGTESNLRRRSNATSTTEPKRKVRVQFELKVTPAGLWKGLDKLRSVTRAKTTENLNAANERITKILKRLPSQFSYSTIYLIILGALTAMFGALMDFIIHELERDLLATKFTLSIRFFFWAAYTIGCLFLAMLITRFVSPAAAGSGIPEMKAILNGVYLDSYLQLNTLVAKVLGLSLAVGSGWENDFISLIYIKGVSFGKEGPFVHLSCIIAHQLCRIPIFKRLQENKELRLQLLSAATGVGVASNFGAPIGGVLFSIEVTSTYYPVRNYSFTFIGSITGAIVFRLLYNAIENKERLAPLIPVALGDYFNSVKAIEFFFFILQGFIMGLIAVLFIKINAFACTRIIRSSNYSPWIFGMVIAMITAVLTFPPFLGDWMASNVYTIIHDLAHSGALSDINNVHNLDWGKFSVLGALFIYAFYRFFITAMAIVLPVPCGIYVPTLVVGASLGRFIGEILKLIFDSQAFQFAGVNIVPGGYAIIGAAALAGGVTHTLSSALIIVELTGDIRFLLPVVLAVLVSVTTAKKISSQSIYDSNANIRGLQLLPDLLQETYDIKAKDLMETSIVSIGRDMKYKNIKKAIEESDWQIIPVVDESEILIGVVFREDLEEEITKIEKSGPINPEVEDAKLDIEMESTPIQLTEESPLSQIHILFTTMHINRAFVTRNGKLIGSVSRKDLKAIIAKKDSSQTVLGD